MAVYITTADPDMQCRFASHEATLARCKRTVLVYISSFLYPYANDWIRRVLPTAEGQNQRKRKTCMHTILLPQVVLVVG